GTPEDRQRAMAVLVAQLVVVSGLTALSVQGARNARALAGQPLELVEQNGVKVLRVVGDSTPEPVPHPESSAKSSEHSATTNGPPNGPHDAGAETGSKPPARGGVGGAGTPTRLPARAIPSAGSRASKAALAQRRRRSSPR
ncbi:MAG TPA: hypothetical protein VGD37_30895, partial [Kofleriaceae bacterium]